MPHNGIKYAQSEADNNTAQMYKNLLFQLSPALVDQVFLETDFGKLYGSIPFQQLASLIPAPKGILGGKGCKAWLSVEGGIALLIAKHYLQLSDSLLIERLNTDWSLQLFCGIRLRADERIRDEDLPGRWRRYIGRYLDIDQWQLTLASSWKDQIHQSHVALTDATCYESYITFPTDVKLIWKSCGEVYTLINDIRKNQKLRVSRANHKKWRDRYLAFSRNRKKGKRKSKKLCRSLLKYLTRLLKELDKLRPRSKRLSRRRLGRLRTIETLKEQQWQLHFGKQSRAPERIVSLHKPYVRPIVRGKEIKDVEFGAKVNKLQVDGISFIEHISYNAFHEGVRLQSTIEMHERYFGKCSQLGADAIYANNENRKYCTTNHIATNFVSKGREMRRPVEQKQRSQMRSILGKARSTQLEGSFGNEKQHYLLDKVRAGTQASEIAWIFFGMFASNAVRITKRRMNSRSSKKAA
jgi:transposase, IS5 family